MDTGGSKAGGGEDEPGDEENVMTASVQDGKDERVRLEVVWWMRLRLAFVNDSIATT